MRSQKTEKILLGLRQTIEYVKEHPVVDQIGVGIAIVHEMALRDKALAESVLTAPVVVEVDDSDVLEFKGGYYAPRDPDGLRRIP